MGAYDGDPLGRLGYLKSILFRCGRLVVDTGIHAKRWTKQQGVNWMVESGAGVLSMVDGEVNRYCVGPGQACAYMIGKIEIDRLRAQATTRLGNRFRITEFHDAVLRGGAMPLETLNRVIGNYIDQRLKA